MKARYILKQRRKMNTINIRNTQFLKVYKIVSTLKSGASMIYDLVIWVKGSKLAEALKMP